MLPASTQAAPPFSAVEPGFDGTQFRGLSLGQTRSEVEAALSANGLRCLTPKEVLGGGTPAVEGMNGFTTCRIVAAGDRPQYSVVGLNEALNRELLFGMPFYGVSFLNDVASALSFTPDYFNVGANTTPLSFAQSIADNYDLPDGLEGTQSGWQGHTSKGEVVTLYQIDQWFPMVMTVQALTPANTPSFD
ncbi:hypothetical protein [Devosia sp.]|uniref:hypothetical protein n=1 Tax=Devosia sp. TaxID=1871048 RepID=UPI00326659A0